MKLTKFPVVTSKREYHVDIEQIDGYFEKYYQINIYVKKDRAKFSPFRVFGKKKFRRLNTITRDYKEFLGEYVQMAKDAIENYETWEEEQNRKTLIHNQGLEKWNTWDGKFQ